MRQNSVLLFWDDWQRQAQDCPKTEPCCRVCVKLAMATTGGVELEAIDLHTVRRWATRYQIYTWIRPEISMCRLEYDLEILNG